MWDVVSDQANHIPDLVEEDVVNVPPRNTLDVDVLNTNPSPIRSNTDDKPVTSLLAPN